MKNHHIFDEHISTDNNHLQKSWKILGHCDTNWLHWEYRHHLNGIHNLYRFLFRFLMINICQTLLRIKHNLKLARRREIHDCNHKDNMKMWILFFFQFSTEQKSLRIIYKIWYCLICAKEKWTNSINTWVHFSNSLSSLSVQQLL